MMHLGAGFAPAPGAETTAEENAMADGATLESQIEELLDRETFEPPEAFAEKALITDESVVESADSETGSPIGWTLANPGIVSIPLGFLGCWLGTVLSKERGAERTYHELYVRSETGLGAERALVETR